MKYFTRPLKNTVLLVVPSKIELGVYILSKDQNAKKYSQPLLKSTQNCLEIVLVTTCTKYHLLYKPIRWSIQWLNTVIPVLVTAAFNNCATKKIP